jgi:hypothetical protein
VRQGVRKFYRADNAQPHTQHDAESGALQRDDKTGTNQAHGKIEGAIYQGGSYSFSGDKDPENHPGCFWCKTSLVVIILVKNLGYNT